MGSVSDQIRGIARGIINDCGFKSAVLSGIAGDPEHLARGGFHCSVLELRAHGNQDDYSNTRSADRNQNVAYASAIDISLSSGEMVKAFARVHAVWSDRADPRRVYVNAINGWDGSGDATRLDFDAEVSKYASPDHKWHQHIEIHRRYNLDDKAARAVVSIFQGQSKAAWIAANEPKQVVTMLPIAGQLPQLKRGMKDPVNDWYMVGRVQLLLGITVDGDYGPKTAAAVAAYDLKNLKRHTDGSTVDMALWRQLYGITGS